MHFDEEMGFQYLGPGITVLSPSDPRPPTALCFFHVGVLWSIPDLRDFSAGSYSGTCLLHLLWNMPHVQAGSILGGIACPPALLHGI